MTFILIGAVTMNTVQIAQLDLSYALLYSVWSKSLKHEFIAPIRLGHILLGCRPDGADPGLPGLSAHGRLERLVSSTWTYAGRARRA